MLTELVVEVLLDDRQFIEALQKRGFVTDRDELGYFLMRSLFVDFNPEMGIGCIERYVVRIKKAPYTSARMRIRDPVMALCNGCSLRTTCRLTTARAGTNKDATSTTQQR